MARGKDLAPTSPCVGLDQNNNHHETSIMKLVRLLLASLVLAQAALTAHARPFPDIQKSGKLIVATGGEFPPFNYFEGKKLTGFEIEVAEIVVKKMGLAIEWKTMGFDSLLAGLQQDRWDIVVSSHGVTEERAKAVDFASPHYCSGSSIVSRDPAVRAPADLNGKLVGVQTGSTYLENVRKLTKPKEIKNFPQDRDARTALATGRVDAWVTDKFVALAAVKSNPEANLKLGDLLFVERIAAAVGKGNMGLAAAYNKALGEALADGSYAAVSNKYFGEDVRCK
jgi:polar amino acid transport system substrate-binding protein